MFLDAIYEYVVAFVRCGHLIHYYNVQAFEDRLMVAKRFPDNAFEAVAGCCLLALFLRYRQTESRYVKFVFTAQHRKPFIPAARCFLKHAAERRSIQQPAVFAKPVPSIAFQIGNFACRQDGRDGA